MSPASISPARKATIAATTLAAAGLVLASALPSSALTSSALPSSALPSSALAGTTAPDQAAAPSAATADPAPLRTLTVSTQAQLTDAVRNATAGTAIKLRAGTYNGGITITRSGTASAPISLSPAGDGPVTMTASLRMPSCGATSPDPARTIRFEGGASYWTISGMQIRGGVFLAGNGAGALQKWFGGLVNKGDWQTRRAIPGHGTRDRAAANSALNHVAGKIRQTLRPSDGVKIIGNDISLKGIHSAMNRYGTITGNNIHDIACGVGPGVWLGSLSDGWTITNNRVSAITSSSHKHYMQEAIRIGGGSSYNLISGNTAENLPGDGRAFTTDQDASWNTFSRNTARNVAIGYNDQMSGWGNTWEYNTVSSFRTAAFSFRAMDSSLPTPSMNSSTYLATVRCNVASGPGVSLQAGALKSSTFASNAFGSVNLGKNLRSYWGAQGNVWNGSKTPPADRVAATTAGC